MARFKICPRTGKTLKLDEKTGEWKPDRQRECKLDLSRPIAIMPDIREFVSIAGHKPELITSRSQLARHERSNNMRQVGNDLKGRITERTNSKAARDAETIRKGGVKVTWSDYNARSV